MTVVRALFVFLLVANAAYFYWLGLANDRAAAGLSQGLATQGESAVDSIVLLSEIQPLAGTVSRAAAPLDTDSSFTSGPASAGVYADDALCWYIDNSAEGQSRQQLDDGLVMLSARLAGLDIRSRVVNVQVERASTFLVYLPPYPSREEALRVLKGLLAKGHDAFLLEAGEFRNGISLGFFIQRESAEQLQQDYRAQSLDARVKPHLEQVEEKRLQLVERENRKISTQLWSNLRTSLPGLGRQKNYCNNIVAPL